MAQSYMSQSAKLHLKAQFLEDKSSQISALAPDFEWEIEREDGNP